MRHTLWIALLSLALAACTTEDAPQESPRLDHLSDLGVFRDISPEGDQGQEADQADQGQADPDLPDPQADLGAPDLPQPDMADPPDATEPPADMGPPQDMGGQDVTEPPEDIGASDAAPDLAEPDMAEPDAVEPDAVEPEDMGAPDTGLEDCPDNEALFEAEVWEPTMLRRCSGCHQAGGLAAGTRMVLHFPEEGPQWAAQNLEMLTTLSLEEDQGLPVLLARPSGEHSQGHTGGTLLTPNTGGYLALERLVRRLRGDTDTCDRPLRDIEPDPDACQDIAPSPRLLRRLTHLAYQNSIRDLTGVEIEVEGRLSADTVVHGFDNNADALQVSPLLADQYRNLAEEVGQAVDVAHLAPCGRDQDALSCGGAFVARFGQRAFRRPLTEAEQARYLELFQAVHAEDGYDEAARWVVVALLQSPHFLYRAELGHQAQGQQFQLTPWEIASELSYLFWATTPDDTLLELAASGELAQPEIIQAQARRLLEDARSQEVAWAFAWRWLGLDQLMVVTRDPEIYPALSPALRQDMARETARLLGELWTRGDTLSDLLTAEHTWLNPALAEHYGLEPGDAPPDAEGWRRVSLSGSPYGGLLTQASLLTTHALPTGSSPIHRGLMVRERLLCQPLPPPPANLDTSPPPVDPTLSTRERYAQHSDDMACAGCHDLIDPIGFGFEHFDATGRWRAQDGVHDIDASGEIINSVASDGLFDGVQDLSSRLASSPDVSTCYVRQWMRFGYGLEERLDADCMVPALASEVEQSGGQLSGALLALTRQGHFTARQGEPQERDVPYGPVAPLFAEVAPEDHVDPDSGGFQVELDEYSRWQSGYCTRVYVTNTNEEAGEWSVTLYVEGTIYNAWSSQRDADSGDVTFTGAEYNRSLNPGQRIDFGFCANL